MYYNYIILTIYANSSDEQKKGHQHISGNLSVPVAYKDKFFQIVVEKRPKALEKLSLIIAIASVMQLLRLTSSSKVDNAIPELVYQFIKEAPLFHRSLICAFSLFTK